MASYTVERAAHHTLVGSTVDTITFTGRWKSLAVTHRTSGGADIYMSFGLGSDATVQTPSNADDSYIVQAGTVKSFSSPGTHFVVVKLFSTGTPAYSVEGL